MMNRPIKHRLPRVPGSGPGDLENEFIIRLPQAQANVVRQALSQEHMNIKDRLFIQLDHTNDKDDLRNGIITLDTMMHRARLVDMPTIMETWKTIDGKNFYKTADVCQMLIVREDEDPPEDEDSKRKKRDPNKVDKKYLWPHGYTPPLKNVRKRRFRKTLRKKNLELPEIEKEVRRLLRTDNEAINVRWEVVREEDERKHTGEFASANLDEQLFGGALSSSDDEVGATINIIDDDDDSHLSVDDSHLSDPLTSDMNQNSPLHRASATATPLVTEFTPGMFGSEGDTLTPLLPLPPQPITPSPSTSKGKGRSSKKLSAIKKEEMKEEMFAATHDIGQMYSRLATYESEVSALSAERLSQESQIANIDNIALKQRLLARLAEIDANIEQRHIEINDIRMQLEIS